MDSGQDYIFCVCFVRACACMCMANLIGDGVQYCNEFHCLQGCSVYLAALPTGVQHRLLVGQNFNMWKAWMVSSDKGRRECNRSSQECNGVKDESATGGTEMKRADRKV